MTELKQEVDERELAGLASGGNSEKHEVIMKNEIPGNVTLLYVEDDPATREMVAKMLKKNGFNCIVAENGQEGLLATLVKASHPRIFPRFSTHISPPRKWTSTKGKVWV